MSNRITRTALYTVAIAVAFLVIYLLVGLFVSDPSQHLFISLVGVIAGVIIARVRGKVFDGKPSVFTQE